MIAKDVLNELKWHPKKDLKKAEIWYLHRGAENNTKIILGSEIKELMNSFMRTENAMIPYHRIFKIIYEGEVVFSRKSK